MRHENLDLSQSVEPVDAEAVWPRIAELAPVASPNAEGNGDRPKPASAAPELPVAAGMMIAGTYFVLIASLAFATVGSGKSVFMIVISCFFACMFFSVPAIFLRVCRDEGHSSLDRFLCDGMQTLTGHCSGREALVQMLIVPVCLTFGVVAIGIASAFIF